MATFFSHDIKAVLKDKWLLWDTSALIRIVDCDAEEVFGELVSMGLKENVAIKPVVLELGATKDLRLRAKRAEYMDNYIGVTLPTDLDNTNDKTLQIQQSIPVSGQPGAVDLMLASTLLRYQASMLLITENVRDFPEPLFKKEGFVMVANAGQSFGLTVLSVDTTHLAK